uniref:C3H1-type domain-containing protein n=1 Tax=Sexangularia sp. CB-2014 TaxID=1486929 RepID=A0A7S1YJT2_9EUKA|mmetsp:Transcript_6390/g.20738  ORF Transcript_6390/g.20738 Transcript_6390/m.20738 type:complete len:379 (+) Transcript_6390:46-1182(+)
MPDSFCKHFVRGNCRYGDSCSYRHPTDEAEIEKIRSENPLLTATGWAAAKRRGAVRNGSKSAEFRRFLLQTFGVELLQSGRGVLDVAGGKGELAFELVNLSGIPTTTIDPRPLNRLNQYARRALRGLYHASCGDPAQQFNLAMPEAPSSLAQLRGPDHLRCFFGPLLWQPASDERRATFDEGIEEARRVVWTSQGHKKADSADPQGSAQDDGDATLSTFGRGAVYRCECGVECTRPDALEVHRRGRRHAERMAAGGRDPIQLEAARLIDTYEDALDLVARCSVLVGLHPDQAAGPIVEAAVALGKPFAVIPCCTYSAEFPKRKLPDGTRVTTHGHLVEYLRTRLPDGQTAIKTLDFGGKNIVVYSVPPQQRQGEGTTD